MKQRVRHLLSVLLVCAMVLSLLPISVLAEELETPLTTVTEPAGVPEPEGEGEPGEEPKPEPELTPEPADEPAPAPKIVYVGGTDENHFDSLAAAVTAINNMPETNFVIEVQSDLTATKCARITNKHVTITSATGEGSPYTITRGNSFDTISDNGRSWYNPAMIEVTVLEGHTASVTLKNIVLNDAGNHEGDIFAQAKKIDPPNEDDRSNLKYVQDAMVAAYGLAENSSQIFLDEGAVLKNFGGMSAVRVTGGASLTMNSGSLICDDPTTDRIKDNQGGHGPAGAVWVQGTTAEMWPGSQISGVVGRAIFADGGKVTIGGTISNITADSDMWNSLQGIALHSRNSSDVTITGTIENITPSLSNSNIIYSEYSSFVLGATGLIQSCNNTASTGFGGLLYIDASETKKGDGSSTYYNVELNGLISECEAGGSLLFIVNTHLPLVVGSNAVIQGNEAGVLFYHNTAENVLDIYGKITNNTCTSSIFYGGNTGHEVYLHDGAKVNSNHIVGTAEGGIFAFGTNRIITLEEGSEVCNNTVANGSIISEKAEGNRFNMKGGTISGNNVTNGSLFSFASGSWNWPSTFEIKGGTISGNTAPHDFTVAVHKKEKIANSGSYFLIPNNGMNKVYFEKDTKTVTADSGTKLGNANDQQTNYAVTPDVKVGSDPRSVVNLKAAAVSYSCKDPFATFWAQNENGTPVTVKMDDPRAFDSSKSVYVLIEETDKKGAPAQNAEVQLLPAVVNTDGIIRFTLPGNANGYAVGLVQVDPTLVKGTLTLTTSVTELTEGNTPYTIPYKATFTPNTSTELWTIDKVKFTSPLFTAGEVALTNNTAQWTATLDAPQFRAGQSVDAVAILTVTIDKQVVKILSNSVSTKMIEGTTPPPDPGDGGGTGSRDDYTLHYVTNGGNHLSSETKSSSWTKDYEDLPIPVRDGYTFEGWYWDLRLTEPVTGDVKVDKTTVTLYAKWSGGSYGPDDTGVSKWLETDEHNAFLSGYPDGSFQADKNMTRAEVAQMFYALLLDKNVTITKSFSDVPSDAWYAKAVNTLSSLGMLGGYPDGTFRPDAPITRAEFAAIALAFAYDPASASCSYTDVSANAWYYTYVAQATTYGWIGGYPDGSFRPNNSITRAEVAVIVNNMLGRDADESYINRNANELVSFVDLSKNHWAYYTIMESTNSHDYTASSNGESWKA